jgi:RNA methyltransferase, TrmH family
VITSADNEKLKTIRKLQQKHWREKLGLFAAEGEDLVEAAERAGWEPDFVLRAGEEVEPSLLAAVSALGSGSRVIGVYRERWSEPGGSLAVYLHGVEDPGNVGTVIRSAHALCDGPVILGPGCADPFSPKAVRGSMGSLFARPPARSDFSLLQGTRVALASSGLRSIAHVAEEIAGELPGRRDARSIVVCLGAEREGLPDDLLAAADAVARIPLRADGPESLNVGMAATVALYEVANRMAAHA